MKKYLFGIKSSFTRLPDKKRYLELITALLSIPVLATAIVLNFNNLKPKAAPTPTPTVQEKIVYISPKDEDKATPAPDTEECRKDIAPLDITSPRDNETVTDNPVSINIDYTQGSYCAAVWSYRINGGRWSDYSDRSVALFNLPKGTVHFELRVKSIVTGKEKNYTRTFIYDGDTSANLQNSQNASSSATQ